MITLYIAHLVSCARPSGKEGLGTPAQFLCEHPDGHGYSSGREQILTCHTHNSCILFGSYYLWQSKL